MGQCDDTIGKYPVCHQIPWQEPKISAAFKGTEYDIKRIKPPYWDMTCRVTEPDESWSRWVSCPENNNRHYDSISGQGGSLNGEAVDYYTDPCEIASG
jgi:hypothetical protein